MNTDIYKSEAVRESVLKICKLENLKISLEIYLLFSFRVQMVLLNKVRKYIVLIITVSHLKRAGDLLK